jgi:hypothetical protein
MPILGAVLMYSGRHVVKIDYLILCRKSDHEEGVFWGLILKFKSLNLLNKNNLISTFIEHSISKKQTGHIISKK